MSNIQEIKNIFKKNNIAVLKKFGQNFLISETVLNKIIETANIKPTDTILEIGPGLGVLTFELAKRASKVIAIEKDRKMAEILGENLAEKNISNVEVINEDIFDSRLMIQDSRIKQSYKIVANLPYNIATAVIMKFLQSKNPPQQIVVMVQKEVAQRIAAEPPHMNKLAIFCGLYSTPKIIDIVPPSAFYPKPKVDSAILRLTPNGVRHMSDTCLTPIIDLGFSHPRKTLLNNLYEGRPGTASKEEIILWLKENNIQPSQRPETLNIHNWLCLAKTFKTLHNN
ncbi:MAG: 16S rRNA (adenine(1518)-N(6)/adenine(1519)-N(6))-dimethyltransferase RsmA [bacterium]